MSGGLDERRLLSPDRIDLWLARCGDPDEMLLRRYRGLLSREEEVVSRRFHFDRDCRRYVITRAMVRTVLSQYAPTPPAAWRFACNAYGRPQIANDGDTEQALSFNVAHSHDLILLGVTCVNRLGVDVEWLSARGTALEVAERFFGSDEIAALKSLPRDRQISRFLDYWTLKESFVKAQGVGLSMSLGSVEFDLSHDAIIGFRFMGLPDELATDWRFWQLHPAPGYTAAVSVRLMSDIEPTLSLREIIPLTAVAPLGCNILGQSAASTD
jgi:4'-phosphopantetheinyl transferase